MRITSLLRRTRALRLLALLPTGLLGQSAPSDAFVPLPAPTVTIGAEGDPDYEFTTLGATHRLTTGEIVVTDWQSPVIRIFSSQGRLVGKLGRKGSGPGEFQGVDNLFLVGDTLIVYDWHLRRVTHLLRNGTVLSTRLVEPSAETPVDLVGRLPTGRWLVASSHAPSWGHGHGTYRDTVRVGSMAPSGSGTVRWLPTVYPGMSIFAYMPSDDRTRWVVGRLSYSATTIVRATGDTILVGDTAVPELQRWRADGRALPPLRLPLPSITDFRPFLNAERDEELARPGSEQQKPYILASRDATRTPPRYRDFTVAANGDVWVRLYGRTPTDSTRYVVVRQDNTLRARVSMPRGSSVLAIEPPWVFARLTDQDDVETLAVIRWSAR